MSQENYEEEEEEIIKKVMAHMKWDLSKAELWYNLENPLLGGCSPKDLVERDRGHKVMQFINAAIEESTAPSKETNE